MTNLWHFILNLIRLIIDFLNDQWRKATAVSIEFDTGRSVQPGKQIAEGGFSFVFEATDRRGHKYALKRIHVSDREGLQGCLREAGVHRSLQHPHLMPLLGLCQEKTVVYMLFPYMKQSLRGLVNKAIFETPHPQKPLAELKLLQMFHKILSGVLVMHDANYSHRDIKLENILIDKSGNPVLMDFGSVGALEERIDQRSQVNHIVETASQHTTLPYRPPELLEGGVRAGDEPIDFGKVDVWSLGCTLFAMCYGASPYECEFRGGEIRIVECTQLRILGKLPSPPSSWYSSQLLETMNSILNHDRNSRMNLDEFIVEIEALIQKEGGRVPKVVNKGRDNDGSDLDALLTSNRFV